MKLEIKPKLNLKGKVEDDIKNGDAHSAWRQIKSMVGIQDKKRGLLNPDKSNSALAEKLNQSNMRL